MVRDEKLKTPDFIKTRKMDDSLPSLLLSYDRYKTLILPVFIHGTYDFVTFMLPEGYLAIVGFVIGVLIVVLSYVYIRKRKPTFRSIICPSFEQR